VESGVEESAVDVSAVDVSGIAASGIAASGIAASGMAESGIALSAMELSPPPSGVLPVVVSSEEHAMSASVETATKRQVERIEISFLFGFRGVSGCLG
jgi:hypothetical protein